MSTLALRRNHPPFWPAVALAILAWLAAWFAAWPVSQWFAFEFLGLAAGSPLGEAVAGRPRDNTEHHDERRAAVASLRHSDPGACENDHQQPDDHR